MSALNNAWNPFVGSDAYITGWEDTRNIYGSEIGSPYQQQAQMIHRRPAPQLSDMPEQLLQELSAEPNAQRMWENMSGDEQWRLIDRYEKQQAQAREQEKIDAYDPNNDNAYSVSLSTAVDLWRAKHGDTWVREQTVYVTGDFYGELENRLCNNNCFERMSKYDRTWLRLKENI